MKDQFTAAMARLAMDAQVCEHNVPIHQAQGDAAQAALSRANAAAYRAAVQALRAACG